jgi:hypothetical protein
MNAFLNSLRADLLDRRLRAVLILLTAGLVGALAYAVTGGSGSTSAPGLSSPPAVSSAGSGIAPVAVAANASQAVAETTSGSSHQRGGSARDPFIPLPGSVVAQPSGSSKSSSSSSSSATKPTPSTSSPVTPPASRKPTTPAKPKTAYHVEALFGEIPAGTPPQNAQLTPYKDLKLQQKLPSTQTRLLAFNGVEAGGKRATFKLVGEALLRGTAVCLPSPSQCLEIALSPGQSEELEYLPASGTPVVYELQLVSITSVTASTATVRGMRARMSKGALVVEPIATGASLWRRHLGGTRTGTTASVRRKRAGARA